MAETVPVITLDGPSGVGKGTICLLVAKKLGWHMLDSGSLYRLTALKAQQDGVLDKLDQLVEIAGNIEAETVDEQGQLRFYLAGVDVTETIRSEVIGELASSIATIDQVRAALLRRQRDYAQPPGLVADGRDMGTVVFPQAELKIYLTASPEIRLKRRYKQLIEKGIDVNLPDLVSELQTRDERDSKRETAPLKAAPDAITIDTTQLAIAEVVAQVMDQASLRFAS